MSDNGFLEDNDIDVNEIPDSTNLEGGSYDQVLIEKVSNVKVKAKKEGEQDRMNVVVKFKDIDPDSETLGLTFDWWIRVPHKGERTEAIWFKRNLKTVGLSDQQIGELGLFDKNPEQREWFEGITGSLVLKTKNGYTNLLSFKADEVPEFSTPDNQNSEATTPASEPTKTSLDLSEWD